MGRGALGSTEEELEDSEDDSGGSSEEVSEGYSEGISGGNSEDEIGGSSEDDSARKDEVSDGCDEEGSEEDSDGDVDKNSETGEEDGAAEVELFSNGDGSEDSVIEAGTLVSDGTRLLASPDPQLDKRNAEDTKANIFLTLFFIRSFLLNGFADI